MRNTFAVLTLMALLPPAASTAQELRHQLRASEMVLRHQLDAARFQIEHNLAAAVRATMPAIQADMVIAFDAAFAGAHALRLPESFAPQDPADSLWREGRSLMNRSDFRTAAQLFRRIRTDARFSGSAYLPGAYYWEAYSISKYGDRDELRRARELLATARSRYPRDQQLRDAPALAATIEGTLARGGDAEAASNVQRSASPSPARSPAAATSPRTAPASARGQCPSEEDDVRAVAMNALLQMDAANAVPILREVMARRDECSAPLRRKAIFLLSQKRGEGVDQVLLDAVRNDPDPEVREAAVFWLSQVNTPQAVAALEDILRTSTDRKIQEKALFAMSQNRSDRAAEVLRTYARRTDIPVDLRRNAIFWLGQRQGPENAEFLRSLYPQIQDPEVKEHIVFAVSQAPDPRNAEWLLDLALREGESMEARKRALFFAAQRGELPVQRVAQLYDRTPDREMKEQILFALSQRVRDSAAVDKLMDIGKNETDKELRNRAIFWLSESRDPRVSEFLLEIIKR